MSKEPRPFKHEFKKLPKEERQWLSPLMATRARVCRRCGLQIMDGVPINELDCDMRLVKEVMNE